MNRTELHNVISALVKMRDSATDEQAAVAVWIYPAWKSDAQYSSGDRVRYGETLYKCIAIHNAQEAWNPSDASSLWAAILPGQDGTAIGAWKQPDSTNPYMTGDRVIYNGIVYESVVDGNVWRPGVYGWNKVQ